MPVAARPCPSCAASLAEDAAFCHRCGAAAAPGAPGAPGSPAPADAAGPDGASCPALRAPLQRALGPGYQLRHLLGRGGFAEVHAAWDVRLRREVAVKTLRPDVVLSDAMRARFRREVDAAASLRHPHLVPIYDVGESDDVVYFTMPRIEGETLADVLAREGRLPVAEAVRILSEAGGALAAAHRAGVVHRDVKPENIMLEGLDRRVVLTDFGIAKWAHGGDALTGTGLTIGTPQYMSPEQTLGERDVDQRADQYSLAMVGYHALAGELPFGDASPRAVMFRQVTEVPPALHEVRADVPPALAAVIARALAKEPDLRYPSVQAFVAALADAASLRAPMPRAAARLPGAAARIAAGRALLARRRLAVALAGGGVALAAAAAALVPLPPGAGTAARRDEAVFAGRAFLRELGQPRAAMDRAALVTEDSVHRHLQGLVGRAEAARRGAEEGAVWRWRLHAYDAGRRVARQVDLTPDGRIVAFAEVPADTAAVRLSADSARALAVRALAARGHDASRLQLVRESGTRGGATAYAFETRPAGDAPGRRVRVEVTGDRVTRFAESYDVPAAASAAVAGALATGARVLGWVLTIAGLAWAGVVAVRRGREDVVDWGMGARVAVACVAAVLLLVGVELAAEALVPASPADDRWSGPIGLAVMTPIALAVMAAVTAAAESLARAHRPHLVLGLHELGRGRRAPEVPGAVRLGYALGAAAVGLGALVEALGAVATGGPTPSGVPVALEGASPWPALAMTAGIAVGGALLLAFAGALSAARRLPGWAAVAWPVALFALVGAPERGHEVAPWLGDLVVFAGAGLAVWRWGVVAGACALLVGMTLPQLVGTLGAGSDWWAWRGAAFAAVVLAPLGATAWLARGVTGGTRATTPGATPGTTPGATPGATPAGGIAGA